MKTAIYIEDGVTQLVLTPENDWETNVIKLVHKETANAQIYLGGFYHCQGGWDRRSGEKDSLIIRVNLNPPL